MEWTMKRCGAAATAGVVLSFVLLAVFLNTWFLLSGGASLPTSAGATVQQAGKRSLTSECRQLLKDAFSSKAGGSSPQHEATDRQQQSEPAQTPQDKQHQHQQQQQQQQPQQQQQKQDKPVQGARGPEPLLEGANLSRSIWHRTVTDSAKKAELLLRSAGVSRADRAGRIFIPMLSFRPDWLCRMVQSYNKHVAPYNNMSDMFVFSPGNKAEAAFKEACGDTKAAGTIWFMPLNEHWTQPNGSAADMSLWTPVSKKHEYRIMGHWRLLFQYTLADMLGYKYLWQLDDDSELSLPLKASLIPWMKQHKVLMAYRRAYRDKVMVTWGLPELTRTFLVAERYSPVGTLFQHTDPPGIDGLYTTKNLTASEFKSSGGGWDRTILYGNCMMVDVDFWFQPLVQRYIELVTSTWYHYRFRWNEQSTVGMVWQLFVPKDQTRHLPILKGGYKHKVKVVNR